MFLRRLIFKQNLLKVFGIVYYIWRIYYINQIVYLSFEQHGGHGESSIFQLGRAGQTKRKLIEVIGSLCVI